MRLKTQTVVLLALVALFAFFLGRGTDSLAAGKQAGTVNQQQGRGAQQQAQLAEQPQADSSVSGSGGVENEDCEAPGAEPGEVEDQDEPGDVDKPCPERP